MNAFFFSIINDLLFPINSMSSTYNITTNVELFLVKVVRTTSVTITQVSEEEREEESGLLLQCNRQSQDWGTLLTILPIYLMPHVIHALFSCLMV